MLRQFTSTMTTGTRWTAAHVYIARCTEEGGTHWAPCCGGGTIALKGRLLVILGEHLAVGDVAVARAVLEHERRHVAGWRLYAFVLATFAGFWGLLLAGWTVTPWPALLVVVAGLRLARTAVRWVVEVSCDVGAARDTGQGGMLATIDHKERTEGGSLALQPPVRRGVITVLQFLASQEHPSYRARRWAIRALAG